MNIYINHILNHRVKSVEVNAFAMDAANVASVIISLTPGDIAVFENT